MDDEAETYKLWRVRKTIMQVIYSLLFYPVRQKNMKALKAYGLCLSTSQSFFLNFLALS